VCASVFEMRHQFSQNGLHKAQRSVNYVVYEWQAHDNKQLLDEVFVIYRIIKVEVGVIRQSQRLRLITLTENFKKSYVCVSSLTASKTKPLKSCTAVIHDMITRDPITLCIL